MITSDFPIHVIHIAFNIPLMNHQLGHMNILTFLYVAEGSAIDQLNDIYFYIEKYLFILT